MKLYYADTLMPRLACAVATIVKAPARFVLVDLFRGEQRQPAFRELNPNARVPVLEDGELKLWEADAIACYLARRFQPALWPDDLVHEQVRWLSWNARHFTRAGSVLYFERVIKARYLRLDPDLSAVDTAEKDFRRDAAVLDSHLEEKEFLVGNAISVADFAVATALPWADEARLPLSDFPAVQDWYARIEALPGRASPYTNGHS